MGLEETLSALAGKSPYCPWQHMLETMPDKDKKAVEDAVKRGVPMQFIINALRKEGYKTSKDSFVLHMKERCKCIR